MRTRIARPLLGSAAALVVLAVPGCDKSGPVVEMTAARQFDPARLEVEAGDEIVFLNGSADAHSVTADAQEIPRGASYFASGGFSSEEQATDDLAGSLIDPGDELVITLTTPGRYAYYCIPHRDQGMSGVIVVR